MADCGPRMCRARWPAGDGLLKRACLDPRAEPEVRSFSWKLPPRVLGCCLEVQQRREASPLQARPQGVAQAAPEKDHLRAEDAVQLVAIAACRLSSSLS
eukprot:5363624-Pyramimonas_sp.AAC.1